MNRGNLVVDGTQLLMANLAVNDGDYNDEREYLGGLMGLLRQVGNLINKFNPYSTYITFDIAKSKYRLALYPEYKHGRHAKISDDLAERFAYREIHTSYLKTILPMLGVYVLTCPEVEADDVIANFVNKSKRFNTIVSTDKDFIQLVSPTTRLYRPIKNPIMVTTDNVAEVLGYTPELYLTVRTMEGDKSDNIIGVKGVAAKTALKIFDFVGSSESDLILKWAKDECTYKYREPLIEFFESGRCELNHKLMNLSDGPVVDIPELITKCERDYNEAWRFLSELGVKDFMFDEDIHRVLTHYDDLK